MALLNARKGKFRLVRQRRPVSPRLEQLEERCLLSFQIMDLGTLGGPSSHAFGVNSSGQVVGQSDTANQGPHAFVFDGSVMHDLGTLAGRLGSSSAFGINDAGQAVGSSCVAIPCDGRTPIHAFLWDSALGMQDLGTFRGRRNSEARAINNIGEVVGDSSTAQGSLHAFRYIDLTFLDLGTLGGRDSAAYGINDDGVIVGSSQVAPGNGRSPTHAFILTERGMQDLGTLDGGTTSQAFGLNSLGDVVGVSDTPGSFGHAVLWNDQGIQDLGTLGGDGSVALGIDDSDRVVGWSTTQEGGQRAFLYQDGVMSDLNDLIPPGSGLTLISATGIGGNVIGSSIAAFGVINGTRQIHAFLLSEGDTEPNLERARLETSAVVAEVNTAPAMVTVRVPAVVTTPEPEESGGFAGSVHPTQVPPLTALDTMDVRHIIVTHQMESFSEFSVSRIAGVVDDPVI